MLISNSPEMKVFVSVWPFSKNGMITKMTGYCSWSGSPEAMTLEAVRLKWNYRICSGVIITEAVKTNSGSIGCSVAARNKASLQKNGTDKSGSALSSHLVFSCGHSGNNVIPLWGITLF
jgi:hypothetical protein